MTRAPMHRRSFLTLVGGASAAASPLTARAQQAGKLPTVGILGPTAPSIQAQDIAAFVQRLRERGWVENRTVAIEVRWAEGREERYAEIAAEFVRRKVDVILTHSTPATFAAKRATSVIPIVFAAAGDPVGNGLVASLARPGTNVTGLSNQVPDLAGKRVEMLREIVPRLRRLATLGNVGNPASVLELAEVQAAARTLGLEVAAADMRRAEDIAPAFDSLRGRAEALFVSADPLVFNNRIRINTMALVARLPTMTSFAEYVEAGGLMSYGINYTDQYRHAADLVDKILRGTKPADIPVEQPTRFELIVNLFTAKAIGLSIPETFLVRADRVIE